MKRWLQTFSAVLLAGAVLIGAVEWQSARARAKQTAEDKWTLAAGMWLDQAAKEAKGITTKETPREVKELIVLGEDLWKQKPAGIAAANLLEGIEGMKLLQTHLAAIDWKVVDAWEAKVREQTEIVRKLVDDNGKSPSEKLAGISSVHEATKPLLATAPKGANWGLLDETNAEIRRGLQQMKD